MRFFKTTAIVLAAFLLLTGCQKTRSEIVEKTKNVETVEQLKSALGDPDKIDKVGPLAKWTYKAKDGVVVFAIVGDKVTVSVTGD